MEQHICPSCQFPLSENFYFCSNCGKKIKEPPVATTIGKQIRMYALSILLPPFGLWPGIKYISQNDQKAKKIGIAVIMLTILSSIITIWITINIITQVNKAVNTQLQQYQNLGY